MLNTQQFIADCEAVRSKSPLVHNITNYVAMNIAANVLLASGASPLMSFCPEEMDEIVAISSALVINIGCLDRHEIEGMKAAAAAAHRLSKPWVLDPVGAGASNIRTQTALELIKEYGITAFCGTPTLLSIMAKFNRSNATATLRHICISGECMGAEVGRKIRAAFPICRIYHIYGLTEACPRVSYLPPEHFEEYPDCVGIPLKSVSILMSAAAS